MGNRKLTKSKKSRKSRKSKGGGQSRKNHTQAGGANVFVNNLPYILDGDPQFNGEYEQITVNTLRNSLNKDPKLAAFLLDTPSVANQTLFVNKTKYNLIIYFMDGIWFVQDLKIGSDNYSYHNENLSKIPPIKGWKPNTDEDQQRMFETGIVFLPPSLTRIEAEEMTVKQLKRVCDLRGLKNYSNLRKDVLINKMIEEELIEQRTRSRATTPSQQMATPARTPIPQRRGATPLRPPPLRRQRTISAATPPPALSPSYITGGPSVSQLTPSQRRAAIAALRSQVSPQPLQQFNNFMR